MSHSPSRPLRTPECYTVVRRFVGRRTPAQAAAALAAARG